MFPKQLAYTALETRGEEGGREKEGGREEGTAGVNNLRKVAFQGNIVLEAVTKSLEPFECYFISCKV